MIIFDLAMSLFPSNLYMYALLFLWRHDLLFLTGWNLEGAIETTQLLTQGRRAYSYWLENVLYSYWLENVLYVYKFEFEFFVCI